jgi:hypothetical protein
MILAHITKRKYLGIRYLRSTTRASEKTAIIYGGYMVISGDRG